MLSLLIADDELFIRQGLTSINWESHGIRLAGAAANGREALAMATQLRPELILTDIRMPGLTGLELLEALRPVCPLSRTILLTGYQDFSYARQAVSLGAFDYILKPSDPDEIIAVVLRAARAVEDARREKARVEEIQNLYRHTLPQRVQSHLMELIHDAGLAAATDDPDIQMSRAAVMVLDTGHGGDGTAPPPGLVRRLREETAAVSRSQFPCYLLDISISMFAVVCDLSQHPQEEKELLLPLATRLRDALRPLCPGVTLGISRSTGSLNGLSAALNQARNCLKLRNPGHAQDIVHVDDLRILVQKNRVVQDVLAFISGHFAEDISLQSAADHVHVNHIYLSRLLRRETGETFLDILTRTRMDKAAALLAHTDLKTYEISGQVGITDPSYFSQVFRKYHHQTPSEYREALRTPGEEAQP